MSHIIVEFCQNHNGERSILQEMIYAAAENGATYAKIQSIWVKDLTHRERFEEGKKASDGSVQVIRRPYEPERDRLKKLELSLEDHRWFIDECKKARLIPLTTVFTRGDVQSIAELPWPVRVVKLASYDCASKPLIEALKPYFETLFVSTGATHDEEIAATAQLLKDKKTVLFHCVTSYPNTLANCHLARLDYLRQFTAEVGWSDHTHVATNGIKAALAALALGADYVERHFTILKPEQTKDGPVSINPTLLKDLVAFAQLPVKDRISTIRSRVPEFTEMLGLKTRPLSHEELLNRDYYRGRFATHIAGEPVYNWEDNKTV